MGRTIGLCVLASILSSVITAAVMVEVTRGETTSPNEFHCPDDPMTVCARERTSWEVLEQVGKYMDLTDKQEDAEKLGARVKSLEKSAIGWAKAGEFDGSWHCVMDPSGAATSMCFPTALLCSVAVASHRKAACFQMAKAFCTDGGGPKGCFLDEAECRQRSVAATCHETGAFDPRPVLEKM
jgi:hypothetical protein